MRFFILLLLSSISNLIQGQKFDIKWGEEAEHKSYIINFTKTADSAFLKYSCFGKTGFFKATNVKGFLSKYTDPFKEAIEVEFPAEIDDLSNSNIISLKNNNFIVYKGRDKRGDSAIFSFMKIDKNTLKPITQKTVFSKFMMSQGVRWPSLQVKYSYDSSKLLIFGTAPSKKNEPEKYFIGVYDTNFSMLWERLQDVPFVDKYVEIVDYFVTNQGGVFVVIKQFDQGTEKESIKVNGEKVPSYKTKLFYYTNNKATANELTIDIGGKFLQGIQISSESEHELNLFGFYGNLPKGTIAGYFRINYEVSTSTLTKLQMAPFDNQLLDLIHTVDGQGKAKPKDPGITWSYRLAQPVVRADSSKDYIIELFQVQQTTSYKGGYAPTFLLYGDVIDINVKKDGREIITRIPKFQATNLFTTHCSIFPFVYNDKLLLLYNDSPENLSKKISDRQMSIIAFEESDLIVAIIDKNGFVERKQICSHKNLGVVTSVTESVMLAKDRIALYANKNPGLFTSSKNRIGVLTIK